MADKGKIFAGAAFAVGVAVTVAATAYYKMGKGGGNASTEEAVPPSVQSEIDALVAVKVPDAQ